MGFSFYDYASSVSSLSEVLDEESTKVGKRWATSEDLEPLAASEGKDNLWLGDGVRLAFNPEDVEYLNMRNQHVIIVGASGSGKTRSFIIPNIWKAPDCNIVAIDPKGEIDKIASDYLKEQGYEYHVINLVDPEKSDGFDPLAYIKSESDVQTMVEELATSMPGPEEYRDYFWPLTKRAALNSAIGALYSLECVDGSFAAGHDPKEPHKYLRMSRLFDVLDLMDDISDGDTNRISFSVFEYFVKLLKEGGDLVRFKPEGADEVAEAWSGLAALPKTTYGCVVGDVRSTLTPFSSATLRKMYDRPGPRLDKLDEGKQFLDIIISDNDASRAPLVNLLIKIMINQLVRKADESKSKRLDRGVEMLLDEFPNIGAIPDFEKIISTARSRGINFLIVAQTIDQLDGVYGHAVRETIVSNCDTFIYLGGGSSIKTAELVSGLCSEYEVATRTVGDERVRVPIYERVISPGEVGLLKRDKCIVKISGEPACLVNKIDLWSNEDARRDLHF